MKPDTQLAAEIQAMYDENKYVRKQPMYFMKATGNLINDFAKFTDLQSGGKSDDPNDSASAVLPHKPDKDGKTYHTIRDVTYATYKTLMPQGSVDDFYAMTDETRNVFINYFLRQNRHTGRPRIDVLLAYFAWGSGTSYNELKTYQAWYETKLIDEKENDAVLFNRLIDIRLYRLRKMKDAVHYSSGWQAAILNFWNVFKPNKNEKSNNIFNLIINILSPFRLFNY